MKKKNLITISLLTAGLLTLTACGGDLAKQNEDALKTPAAPAPVVETPKETDPYAGMTAQEKDWAMYEDSVEFIPYEGGSMAIEYKGVYRDCTGEEITPEDVFTDWMVVYTSPAKEEILQIACGWVGPDLSDYVAEGNK